MGRIGAVSLVVAGAVALTGCQHPGQNVYRASEVGKASLVNFGTVVAVRDVAVQGENSGLGAMAGAAGGGIAGSQFGSGGGSAAATLVGVVIGGVAGALAEQAASNRTAVEYTVTLQSGVTMTVVQNKNDGDRIIQPGDRVILQVTGGTQRVLPADQLPTQIKRPVGITVTD